VPVEAVDPIWSLLIRSSSIKMTAGTLDIFNCGDYTIG